MEYVRIAVQVYLALGIGLACIALIVTRRAALTRAKQTALDPSPLPEFRPGGDE
jgi:hypothetical protein